MKDGLGLGAGIVDGRALRISRSSKSDIASEMSPSEGSESDTSSIRACDIVSACVVVNGWCCGGATVFGGVEFAELEIELGWIGRRLHVTLLRSLSSLFSLLAS